MSDENVERSGSNESRKGTQALVRNRRTLVWSGVAIAVLAVLSVSMVYTEQSSFCPSCHEMRPYYAAWQEGGHAGHAECVDCHVDAGVLAHLAHKPIALKEVWNHFFTDPRFPSYTVEVPNSRCLSCHRMFKELPGTKFSHRQHALRAPCQNCHATGGHLVTLESLQSEGVLRAAATTPTVPGGSVPSAAVGHIKVSCQECHDQLNMRCSQCHEAPHEPRGECSGCHAPGRKFTFQHGAKGSDCAQCHTPPAGHFAGDCSACHSAGIPFRNTTFSHVARIGEHNYREFPCVKCHPTGYTTSSCTCHGGRPPEGD